MRTARLKKSKTSSVASFTPQKWDQMFLYRCYTSVEDCSIPSKDDGLSSGGLSFGPVGANDEGQPLLRQEELCDVLAAAPSGRQQLSVTWLHGWRMLCRLRCMRWILYTLIPKSASRFGILDGQRHFNKQECRFTRAAPLVADSDWLATQYICDFLL